MEKLEEVWLGMVLQNIDCYKSQIDSVIREKSRGNQNQWISSANPTTLKIVIYIYDLHLCKWNLFKLWIRLLKYYRPKHFIS